MQWTFSHFHNSSETSMVLLLFSSCFIFFPTFCVLHMVGRLSWQSVFERSKYNAEVELTPFLVETKKRTEETQTLRAGCSKAEPKKIAPPQTPFPGAGDGQNLISWRWSLSLPTDPIWWRSMHAISGYRTPTTHKHTHPTTHRQDRLQYTAPQLARSVIIIVRAPKQTDC